MDGAAVADHTIIRSRKNGWVTWTLLALAIATAAGSAFWVTPLRAALYGLAPASLAAAAFFTRPPKTRWQLSAGALELLDPEARRIDFSQINEIYVRYSIAGRLPKPRALSVREGGRRHTCEVSAAPAVEAFVHRLVAGVGFRSTGPVHRDLQGFAAQQAEQFGADRVFHFVGGSRPSVHANRFVAWTIAFAAFAVFLIVASVPDEGSSVCVGLCVAAGIILLGWMLSVGFREDAKPLGGSGLLLGPLGIGLVQGEVRGQLPWSEVRGISRRLAQVTAPSFGVARTLACIGVAVDGAEVLIADIYDRPLSSIEQIIRMYWRGELKCPACGLAIAASTGPGCLACAPASPHVSPTVYCSQTPAPSTN